MAGDRLKYWSTLSKDELQRRVDLERCQTNLSFAETQLLDAALERLRSWRGPSLRKPRERKVNGSENGVNGNGSLQEASVEPVAPPEKAKEKKKVKRTASKARGGKKRNSSGTVAKKKKEATVKARSRIDPEAKVTKMAGAENPYRPNSGRYKRVELVWKNTGKTVEAITKLSGILPQTLNNMRKAELIKIS